MSPREILPHRLKDDYDAWHQLRAVDENDRDVLNAPWNQFVLRHLQEVKNKKILEIACGRGQLSHYLAQQGAEIIAADFSLSALNVAQPAGKGRWIRLVNADVLNPPFKENSFDVIISCETIEHVSHPRKAIEGFRHSLKPGGLLYLTCPNYLNLAGLYRLYTEMRGRKYNSGTLTQPLENWLSPGIVKRWLAQSNFRLIHQSGLGHYWYWPKRPPRNLIPLDETLFLNKLLKPFALHSFFIAKAL